MPAHSFSPSLFLSRSPSLRRSYTRSLPHWLPPFAVSEGWGFTGGPLPSRPTQGSQNSDATSIISRPFQIQPELEEGMRALAPPTPSLFLSFSLFLASFRSYFMACLVCVPVHSGNSSSLKEFNASDLFYTTELRERANCKRKLKFNGSIIGVFCIQLLNKKSFLSHADLIDALYFLDACFRFYSDWFICAFYFKGKKFVFVNFWYICSSFETTFLCCWHHQGHTLTIW